MIVRDVANLAGDRERNVDRIVQRYFVLVLADRADEIRMHAGQVFEAREDARGRSVSTPGVLRLPQCQMLPWSVSTDGLLGQGNLHAE